MGGDLRVGIALVLAALRLACAQGIRLPSKSQAGASVIRFDDFETAQGLSLVGDTTMSRRVLRITGAHPNQAGPFWLREKLPVRSGFDTVPIPTDAPGPAFFSRRGWLRVRFAEFGSGGTGRRWFGWWLRR